MQDDIYQGIGGERQYGPDGEDGVPAERPSREREMSRARDLGRQYASAATEPLRDLQASESRSATASMPSMPSVAGKKKPARTTSLVEEDENRTERQRAIRKALDGSY
jgi:hypothetical protein